MAFGIPTADELESDGEKLLAFAIAHGGPALQNAIRNSLAGLKVTFTVTMHIEESPVPDSPST